MSLIPQHKTPQANFLKQKLNNGLELSQIFDERGHFNEKKEMEFHFLKRFFDPVANHSDLKRFTNQQFKLAHSLSGQAQVFELNWHVVNGKDVSINHDNGFLLHQALGVPYLSGHQVQTLVRNVIERFYDQQKSSDRGDKKRKLIRRWFGRNNKGLKEHPLDEDQLERFTFFDAIPIEPPTLVVDTTEMLPTFHEEHSSDSSIDWTKASLVVKKATLLFSIVERQSGNNGEATVNDVFSVFKTALQSLQADNKTHTDYGYMSYRAEATHKMNKAHSLK